MKIKVAASLAVLALIGSPARSAPVCSDFQPYLIATDAQYAANRGEQVDEAKWKARTPIPGGDCIIAYWAAPRGMSITCSFDEGAARDARLSSYRSLSKLMQECLDGIESRDDWRKRETSKIEFDGDVVTQIVWTWTQIRNRMERQIVLSNNTGGTIPAKNQLEMIWRTRD